MRGGLQRAIAAAAAALAATIVIACKSGSDPNDPCNRLVERLEQDCPDLVPDGGTSTNYNCTGQAACAADCAYNASCDDIKNNSPSFQSCVSSCQ